MVGNWRERKESGVDTKEGAIKVSVLKAVLFLWRGLKPPVVQKYTRDNTIEGTVQIDNFREVMMSRHLVWNISNFNPPEIGST